ncbi:MAG: hypothetical protein EBQ94_07065, partial [Flavobacteriales bacterium]|nr:hypothetical protein [Flavobacteriales bacterium]
IVVFMFLAFGSDDSKETDSEVKKVDINNVSEVKKSIIGKWNYTDLEGSDSENKYYRIEISESQIKFNWKIGWSNSFDENETEVYNYSLTDVYPGENEGDYERYISIDGDLSLGYRIIDPLVIKNNYDGSIGIYRPGAVYEFEKGWK